MKFLYFHVIYLAIIAFLGYNYWSSVQAFKAFEHLNKQLIIDSQAIDELVQRAYDNIDKNQSAYHTPFNQRHYTHTVMVTKTIDSLIAYIQSNVAEFIQLNGGFDTFHSNPILVNVPSTKTSKLFFTEGKIKEFKEKLVHIHKVLTDSIEQNWLKDKLVKQYHLPKLIADNEYWASLKTLPASCILAELSAIKNQIKIDEIAFLNYEENQTAPNYCGFTSYKTAIAPKKAILIEGETFEADVYVASYSSNLGSNVTMQVNGQLLDIKEGVGHFKSKNQTVGTKTIRAQVFIRNPLTAQITTSEGTFEYQVLPKCSRDCQ